ncbi:NAD(+) kinase [Fusarium falciforme]|nr:NAD(+) kinase [Fusarium falciforme]
MTGVLCAASPTALHPPLGSPREGGCLTPSPSSCPLILHNHSTFADDVDKDKIARGTAEQANVGTPLPSPLSLSSPVRAGLPRDTIKPHSRSPSAAAVGDCGPSSAALSSPPKRHGSVKHSFTILSSFNSASFFPCLIFILRFTSAPGSSGQSCPEGHGLFGFPTT